MRTLLLVTTAALAVTCIAEDEDGHVANTEQLFAMGQHRRRWALMPHMAVPPKITTVPTATSGADSNAQTDGEDRSSSCRVYSSRGRAYMQIACRQRSIMTLCPVSCRNVVGKQQCDMQSTLYSLIQKAGAGTPSAVADSHLEDAINRVETGSYYELMLKAGAAPSAASPTLLANAAVKAPPTPDVVLEKAAPASKSRPAAAPKSAAGMSTKRTVEFVRSLLGLRGTATRAHSQLGHNIAEALALWRENPDGISLRSMSKRDAKSKQECARVMKGIPRLKKKRCWEALDVVLTALLSPADETREQAWSLFTLMLPQLSEAREALNVDLLSLGPDTMRHDETDETRQGTGEGFGVRLTPLVAALFTGHHKALGLLARDNRCTQLFQLTGEAPSLLVQLAWMWAYRVPKLIIGELFTAESDGKFLFEPGVDTFWARMRISNREMAQKPKEMGFLEQFGVEYMAEPTSRALIGALAKATSGTESAVNSKVHSLHMNHVTTVLDDELAKTLRPALRCFAQHDSSVDDRGFIGNTALHFAAKRGYEKTAAMLLRAGADPNRQSVSGETPEHLARIESYDGVAELLIAGTTERAPRDLGGFTPDGIAKAKTRKRSFRMHDDAVFAENVRSMYEEVDSERDEHGGWAIGHLAWPSSNATRARRTVCEIDELDPTALTPQQLQAKFLSIKRPAIIRGGCADFYARKVFTRRALRRLLGKVKVSMADIPYKSLFGDEVMTDERISLANVLKYRMGGTLKRAQQILDSVGTDNTTVPPTYVFNKNSQEQDERHKSVERICSVAKIPSSIEWLPRGHGPPAGHMANTQFYLGGAGTGAPFHFHEHAWNALIYGKKRWFLLPPNQAIWSTKPAVEFLKDHYESLRAGEHPPYECVQEAGDIMILPARWSHLVLNLQASIGVAKEFPSFGLGDSN